MIVKSMTWKYAGFTKLASYLTKHRGEPDHYDLEVFHNMIPGDEVLEIADQFRENDDYRKQRKGGVAIYHEIMSFHGEDRENLTPDVLEDLTTKYLQMRAPDSLAFASVHQDRDHTHVHIMISANEYRSDKSTRISKKDFADIQQGIEAYQQENYQLDHSIAYKERTEPNRVSRDRVGPVVDEAFAQARDLEHFTELLEAEGYPVYSYRGKPNGVLVNGSKVRFRQLNFDVGLFDLTLDQYVEGRLSFAENLIAMLKEDQAKDAATKKREETVADLEKKYPYLKLLSEQDPDRQGWINELQKREAEALNKPVSPMAIELRIAEQEERWQWIRENVMTRNERITSDALSIAHSSLSVASEVTHNILDGFRISYSFLGHALVKTGERIREMKRKKSLSDRSQMMQERAREHVPRDEAIRQRAATEERTRQDRKRSTRNDDRSRGR